MEESILEIAAKAEPEKPQGQNAYTPEYLMNYVRLALRNYRFYGRFDMPREWASACEAALAAVAHKLGVLDEAVAREVYGFTEGMQEYAIDLVDARITGVVPITEVAPVERRVNNE